ncbi:DNA-binding transcription factor yap1 [Mucor velutinosus]|uniref:DNA-binding transcription factor yap1 n=1 Tax=Mucor velutinosus TaxID=708070 RepID=A0AAN7DF63_9FUNG|nr:DNA-binding transcription factor yap1 [Mucor velutinosus]
MYPAFNPTPSPNSPPVQQKKKHRNPFTYLFTKQYKSTPTSHLYGQQQEQSKQGIFGVPLCDASKIGSDLWDLRVPDPVALCFDEISKRGLTTEGIFRLSGATSEVSLLENKINMCSPDERKSIDPSQFDIHTLTSLVKKYLRELPEPVIPNAFHEQFQDIDLDFNTVQQLSAIIVKLPFYNRQLLHAILLISAKIQHHVGVNMMSPEALATVFAPVCTGFEQSLKDHMNTSFSTPTATIHKKSKKNAHSSIQQSSNIEQHIKRNKNWTNVWKAMIEQHESLISALDKQMYQAQESQYRSGQDLTWKQHRVYYNHTPASAGNRSLPSPFSTNGSLVPLPNDIMMAQFYPMQPQGTNSIIPVAQPSTAIPPPSCSSPLSASVSATTISSATNYYHQQRSNDTIFEESDSHHNSSSSGFHHSLAKKTSSFFPKSNTIRKILSASTLR